MGRKWYQTPVLEMFLRCHVMGDGQERRCQMWKAGRLRIPQVRSDRDEVSRWELFWSVLRKLTDTAVIPWRGHGVRKHLSSEALNEVHNGLCFLDAAF